MKSLIARLLDLLYPPRCAFCRRLLDENEEGVCRFCRKRYEHDGRSRELEKTEACVAAFRYEGEVRESLLRYKFRGVTAYGPVYAAFLAKELDERQISCDIITWVPLSRKRLRERGYDQSRILAEETAKRLGLPCVRLLEKHFHTRRQSGIKSAEQRRENVKGAYICCAPELAKGRRVLLIDDIVTSGATLTECAAVLKKAGCSAVIAAAAASK